MFRELAVGLQASSRWMAAVLGAVGVALAAMFKVADVAKISRDGWKWVAVISCAVGLAAIAGAVGALVRAVRPLHEELDLQQLLEEAQEKRPQLLAVKVAAEGEETLAGRLQIAHEEMETAKKVRKNDPLNVSKAGAADEAERKHERLNRAAEQLVGHGVYEQALKVVGHATVRLAWAAGVVAVVFLALMSASAFGGVTTGATPTASTTTTAAAVPPDPFLADAGAVAPGTRVRVYLSESTRMGIEGLRNCAEPLTVPYGARAVGGTWAKPVLIIDGEALEPPKPPCWPVRYVLDSESQVELFQGP